MISITTAYRTNIVLTAVQTKENAGENECQILDLMRIPVNKKKKKHEYIANLVSSRSKM